MAEYESNKPENIKTEPVNDTPLEQAAPAKEPLAAEKQETIFRTLKTPCKTRYAVSVCRTSGQVGPKLNKE